MPTRMFFAMDKQIARIRAEKGMRELAISNSSMSGEAAQGVYQTLVAEQGEVYVLSRTTGVVEAEEGAIDKIKAMFG